MNKPKKEPWRIILGILAIGYIIFTWIQKDILQIYATMPQEQVLPMIVTTVAVSLLKVAVMTAVILGVKWLLFKRKS